VNFGKYIGWGLNRTILRAFGLEIRRRSDELRFLRALAPRTILDIGANEGQFVQLARKWAPNAKIYSFEPLPSAYRTLAHKFRYDALFRAEPFALGDCEFTGTLYESAFTPSSSLLRMGDHHLRAFPGTAYVAQHKVVVTTLDKWANARALEEDIFVKIDVQGYEDKVIRGGEQTLKRTKMALVEVSFVELYQGQALFPDICQLMKGLGFELRGTINNVYDPHFGLGLQADAIFARL